MNIYNLFGLFVLIFSSIVSATPPDIPETKMQHREQFIDKDTNEKRRIYKTDYSMGAEIWDSSKNKYVKHGTFLTLHSNKTVNEVIEWKYGVKEGAYQQYNKKGILKKNGSFKNGKKVGEWILYTDKNRLYEKIEYKDGKRHGETIAYNLFIKKDGLPQFIKMYKHGKLHGSHEQYDDKGEKVIWGEYVKGKRNGSWCDYDWGGKIRCVQWENGKRQGN